MIRSYLLLAVLTFTLISCSPYVKYLEGQSNQKFEVRNPKARPVFCSRTPEYNIIHDSNFTQGEFSKVLKKLNSSGTYTIAELGILFYFYQMKVRPDATDYSSRIQMIIRKKDKLFYRDIFNPKRNNLKDAIATLRKSNLIVKNNKKLIRDQRKYFPKKFTVQKELNSYLDSNKNNLSFLKKYKNSYFRLGKPLQKGETYRSPLPVSLISNGISLPEPPLFPLTIEKKDGSSTYCNFDSNLYQKGIFLLKKEKGNSNIFGLMRKNGDSIVFITKKDHDLNYSLNKYSFPGKATKSNASVCFHKGKKTELDLIGYNSRDPGQILYHLFNYGINNSQTITDVVEYLTFPRHQFLTNPSRLIYESKRGTSEQLTYFLSFDFPVYHVEKLAIVYALFGNKSSRTFIADSRKQTLQSCN